MLTPVLTPIVPLRNARADGRLTDMNSAVQLYEALTSAPDDRTRARLIAEAFERLEERYPHLQDLVTQRVLGVSA
jgi:hypothetical protein